MEKHAEESSVYTLKVHKEPEEARKLAESLAL